MTKRAGLEAQLRELREDAPPPSLAARLERAIPTDPAVAAGASSAAAPEMAGTVSMPAVAAASRSCCRVSLTPGGSSAMNQRGRMARLV